MRTLLFGLIGGLLGIVFGAGVAMPFFSWMLLLRWLWPVSLLYLTLCFAAAFIGGWIFALGGIRFALLTGPAHRSRVHDMALRDRLRMNIEESLRQNE
jgi:hypothetical protein